MLRRIPWAGHLPVPVPCLWRAHYGEATGKEKGAGRDVLAGAPGAPGAIGANRAGQSGQWWGALHRDAHWVRQSLWSCAIMGLPLSRSTLGFGRLL